MSPSPTPAVEPASPEAVRRAADLIRQGHLVAFPTETVYGLGADATNDRAVASIFAAKERPDFNPLIVHVPGGDEARHHVVVSDLGARLIDAFWPGPLTLVLRRRDDCRLSRLVSAGLDTAAVRAPSHSVGRALLEACGRPVAAPSANRSGRISPTTADHVLANWPASDDPDEDRPRPTLIIDAGPCPVGLESTVVDATGEQAVILRHGGTSRETIERVVGAVLEARGDDAATPRSPGMMERHYAPAKALRLNADAARDGEVLIGFGPDAPADALNLSPTADLTEAAARLFDLLHRADADPAQSIAVMPIPDTGLGRAINDRLDRASRGEDRP